MSENPRIPQRKKRGRNQDVDPPFPVPIASITQVGASEKNWYYFTGEFQSDCVVVHQSGDIHYLQKMGFFGRGLLSQGMPDFYKRLPNVFIRQENHDVTCYKVARRRMYLRHKQWEKSHDQELTNEDKEYDSEEEYIFEPSSEMTADRGAVDDCEINEQYHQIQDKLKQDTIRQSESKTDQWMDTEGTDNSGEAPVGADNSWGAEHTGNSASWDVEDAGDADFWGCSDSKEKDEIVLDTGKENAKSGTQTHSLKDVDKTSISSCVQENNSIQAEQSVELTLNQDCNMTEGSGNENSCLKVTCPYKIEHSDVSDNNVSNYKTENVLESSGSVTKQCKIIPNIIKTDPFINVSDSRSHVTVTEICHSDTGNGATIANGDTDTADSTSELHETVTEICLSDTGNGATKSNGGTDTADSTSELHETVTDNCPNQSSKLSNDLTKPDSVRQGQALSNHYLINCKGDADLVILFKKTKVDSDDKSASEMSLDIHKLENNSESKNFTESSICDKNSTTKLSSETQEGGIIPEKGSREITPPRVHSYCETEDFGETQEGEVIPEKGSREITPPRVHSHCETEDFGDADYLVIDDSDSEEERGFKRVKMTDVVWKPVLKKDPYPVQEPLMLTLEEAFFLSYGLGCLTVLNTKKEPLTLTDLWCRCCLAKKRFLPSYVAYHYFRSKGWVPKPGLLFGVDYILYRIGPPFYHGSYSVVVRAVQEGTFTEVEEYTNRKFTWTTFSGLHRVTEHVAKSLLMCYVIIPENLSEEDRQSPSCISKFKIKLQVINRWVSSQERGKEEDEMP